MNNEEVLEQRRRENQAEMDRQAREKAEADRAAAELRNANEWRN